MDPSSMTVGFAKERLETFERIRTLLSDSDGQRAIEAAEIYIKLWNDTLRRMADGEFL